MRNEPGLDLVDGRAILSRSGGESLRANVSDAKVTFPLARGVRCGVE